MAKSQADFEARTKAWLRDLAEHLEPEALLDAVEEAVLIYSKDRPKTVVADVVGTGGDIALPATYIDGFSMLTTVEYPTAQLPAPAYVDRNEWVLYRSPTTLILRFLADVPAVAQSVRLTFTGARVLADIPDIDFAAVCALAASFLAEELASRYAQGVDPNINSDTVSGQSLRLAEEQRAKTLRGIYDEHVGNRATVTSEEAAGVGGGSGTAKGASTYAEFVDVDTALYGGAAPLTHPRRWS